jgi:hypothetical protein
MVRVIREGFYKAADTILSASWSPHIRGIYELQRGTLSAGERRIADMLAADKAPARVTDLVEEPAADHHAGKPVLQ